MEAAPSRRPATTPTKVVAGLDGGQRLAGREWWERLAARQATWRQRHQRLTQRWALLRTIGLWLALAGLLVAFALYPEFRAGLRIWLWLYGLLIAWFVVARTKTVSWRLIAGLFSVSVWWSLGIAAVSVWLSRRAGGVRGDGAGTVLAGMTEESLKLVPLAALALAAPGRVRRLAVVDWLLLGFACGLGFQALEELARRTSVAVVRPGLLDALDRLLASISGTNPYGAGSGYPQYGWSLLAGGSGTPLAGYAGHHIFTALVAVTVGLAVAAWRHAARAAGDDRGPGGRSWRVLAVAGPLAVWWMVVADHVGFNATARTSSRAWAQAGNAPRLLRATWDLTGHGFGRGWLLLALLALALLVDTRNLRRGQPLSSPSKQSTDSSPPTIIASPGLAADRWVARLTTWRPNGPRTTSASPIRALGARWATATAAAAARCSPPPSWSWSPATPASPTRPDWRPSPAAGSPSANSTSSAPTPSPPPPPPTPPAEERPPAAWHCSHSPPCWRPACCWHPRSPARSDPH